MATRGDRFKAIGIGTPLLVVGLALAYVPFALWPQTTSNWTAVGAGLMSLVGLTATLAALFMYLLPAVLPFK